MNLNSIWIELPFLHCWQSNYFYPLHNPWTLSCAFSITERFPFAICIINKVLKQMKKTVKKNKKERERSLKTRKIINSKKIRFQKNCFLKKSVFCSSFQSLFLSSRFVRIQSSKNSLRATALHGMLCNLKNILTVAGFVCVLTCRIRIKKRLFLVTLKKTDCQEA